jgi:hypothetical protein
MKLSEHFTLEEFTRSDYAIRHGIDNTPSEQVIENLRNHCIYTLEPLRDIVKKPIHILSGYRCPELNKAIGGAENSQHKEGKASDSIVQGMSVDELFDLASKYVQYDQVIHEFARWLHISTADPSRRMKLWAVKEDGKTVYLTKKDVA